MEPTNEDNRHKQNPQIWRKVEPRRERERERELGESRKEREKRGESNILMRKRDVHGIKNIIFYNCCATVDCYKWQFTVAQLLRNLKITPPL